jgi:hypothetical protein
VGKFREFWGLVVSRVAWMILKMGRFWNIYEGMKGYD